MPITMASDRGVLNQSDLHEGEQISNLSWAWIHDRHKGRLLLKGKADFLVGCQMLA